MQGGVLETEMSNKMSSPWRKVVVLVDLYELMAFAVDLTRVWRKEIGNNTKWQGNNTQKGKTERENRVSI